MGACATYISVATIAWESEGLVDTKLEMVGMCGAGTGDVSREGENDGDWGNSVGDKTCVSRKGLEDKNGPGELG